MQKRLNIVLDTSIVYFKLIYFFDLYNFFLLFKNAIIFISIYTIQLNTIIMMLHQLNTKTFLNADKILKQDKVKYI